MSLELEGVNPKELVSEAEYFLDARYRETRISISQRIFGEALTAKVAHEPLDEKTVRALELRDHSISLIRALNSLLPTPKPLSLIWNKAVAYQYVQEELTRLKELGLKDDMHAQYPPGNLHENLETFTEFVSSAALAEVRTVLPFISGIHGKASKNQLAAISVINNYVDMIDYSFGEAIGTSSERLAEDHHIYP